MRCEMAFSNLPQHHSARARGCAPHPRAQAQHCRALARPAATKDLGERRRRQLRSTVEARSQRRRNKRREQANEHHELPTVARRVWRVLPKVALQRGDDVAYGASCAPQACSCVLIFPCGSLAVNRRVQRWHRVGDALTRRNILRR